MKTKALIFFLVLFQLVKADDLINVSLSSFVDRVSKQTNKSIFLDEDINTSVSLFVPDKISDKNIFAIFKKFIAKKGYILRRSGSVYFLSKPKAEKKVSILYPLKYNNYDDISSFLSTLGYKFKFLKNINSFVLTVPKSRVQYIKSELEKLDKPLKQVFLKIFIIETSNTESFEAGFKFGTAYKGIDGQIQSVVNALVVPYNTSLPIFNTFSFYTALKLLDQKGAISLKQYPLILSKNGSTFKFESVTNVPFLVSESVTNSTVDQVKNTVEYRDVGLKIDGKSIVHDSYISLKLVLSIEDIVDSGETPTTYKRYINSDTNLEYGRVLLISGLRRNKIVKHTYRVPFLSDIPLLGNLFTFKDNSDVVSNISIAIQVYRSGEATLSTPPTAEGAGGSVAPLAIYKKFVYKKK